MSHNSALSQGREIVTQRTFSKKNSTVDLNRQEKELEGRLTEIVQSESRKKKNEEKCTETEGPVGHCHIFRHKYRIPRRGGE